MSYLVLARKYRPRDFAGLVGQEHVVQALANALDRQRLHHAYLFTGTRGVGKTTVSRILAKSLNCTGPDGQGGITSRACGVCAACRDIDAGRFVDYVELDAASNRGVEEITRLLDQAVYKPVVGRFKVYMIDEVHMLSNHAFNAMLKTLEEPPEYLKFVLATTDPQRVPPTVLSRCLQFNLRPMALHTLEAHLADVLARESVEGDAGALRLIARAAHGSMRDALSLADQAIAFGAGALREDGVRQMLGAVDRGHAVRLVEALARRDGRGAVDGVEALRAQGLSAAGTLEEMAALLQQMAVAQAVPDALDRADPDAAEALRLAALLAADETQLLYGIVLHGRAEIGLAPDEYGGLLMVLLRMLAFAPAEAAGVGAASSQGGAGAPAAPAPAPARSQALAKTAPARASAPVAPRAAPAAAVVPDAAPAAVRSAPVSEPPAALAVAAPPTVQPGHAEPAPAEPPPWLDVPAAFGENESDGAAAPSRPPEADGDETPPSRTVPVSTVSSPPADAQPAAEPPRTPLGDRWNAVVRSLVQQGKVGALVRELALQTQCLEIDEGADAAEPQLWRLRVERDALRAPAQRDRLQAALAESLGRPVRLDVELGATDDTPARREIAERERRQREAERSIRDDPVVRDLLQQFATARIVPGSVKPL